MPECKHRFCDVVFEPGGRSKKKEYCCTKHRDKERYLLRIGQQFIVRNGISEKEHQAAREFAIMNCLKYRDCLDAAYMDDNDMGCAGCGESDMVYGAWKKEPGMLYCEDYDFTDHIA